jgi:hypothetical protein
MGGDGGNNQIWWWENPYPNYQLNTNWIRRLIKSGGATKHHDMIFGDFDGDGQAEFAFWNQGAKNLSLAELPSDPRNTQPWPYAPIYQWSGGKSHEGLAKADIDGDGIIDIIGGGRWFKHTAVGTYQANVIDDGQRFSRAAVAQLKPGGRPEIVFVTGDEAGPLKWYEWNGNTWVGRQLLAANVDHGHSLEIGDVNGDNHLDIFVAEMRFAEGSPDHNENALMWVLLGDGQGNFTSELLAQGFGNHDSRLGDLDGDGDLDILGKPYIWGTPRLDVWLNGDESPPDPGCGVSPPPPPEGHVWLRHAIDEARPWQGVFIEAADLDGDGDPDIVTGSWWYKNPGTAGGTWTRHEVGPPFNQHALIYDFDSDGDSDILGAVYDGQNPNQHHKGDEFVWARNDGGGVFTIQSNIQPGSGDFLQGVAAWQTPGGLRVALSWHSGNTVLQQLAVPADPSVETWTISQLSAVSQNEALAIDDIDRDGDPDLLLGTQWLRNDGGIWTAFTLMQTADKADRNRLVDVNGDGRLDAVVGYEAISVIGKVAWYEQPADPTGYWTEHVIAEIIGPMSLDVVDMDGDGDQDVVAGEHNKNAPESARLFIFENIDGDGGQWTQELVYEGDEHHDGAQVVDIDGDGDLDIISIGWTHGRVLIYEQVEAAMISLRQELAYSAYFTVIFSCE